ncbi:Brix-domain-containing protein [Suillus variegatus]|nr:Brix-domain-containing protein [Suillus variegatus]
MTPARFQPSSIKNKIKREEVTRKLKKSKNQAKLQKRLDQAKVEANDPAAKKLCSPAAGPSSAQHVEFSNDIASDPFADYFNFTQDPTIPPKVLITTSAKASKGTYEFCDELVGVFPGAEFIRRKKGKGFEMGRIAELTKQIYLVLNNFSTTLGHNVGRMFQTLFPPLPEFQGRQVVALHNQRDFLFFRRHRYAFRSPEKVALQEIGPRFTLKLRWLKRGLPAVQNFGASPDALEISVGTEELPGPPEETPMPEQDEESEMRPLEPVPVSNPPKDNEYIWRWKPELETTRKTFFL